MQFQMKITRSNILLRGLTNRCPNCGNRTLFCSGTFFKMNERCSACDFRFEGGGSEGFYLRATSLNFGVTLTCFLFPILLFEYHGYIEALTAEVMALLGTLVVPVLIYRASRSWALMNYYFFFPSELPVNGGCGGDRNN
jgi:hypothetical protein